MEKCKWKVRINVSEAFIITFQMKKCERYFEKLNEHLGVTPKPVRNE